MNYKVQINWSFPDEEGWQTVGEYIDLEKGKSRINHDSNLSRVCATLRLIDEENKVHYRYNPQYDSRLVGSYSILIEKRAIKLYKENPERNSEEIFSDAEHQIISEADDGIRDGDFTEEEKNI